MCLDYVLMRVGLSLTVGPFGRPVTLLMEYPSSTQAAAVGGSPLAIYLILKIIIVR